jgi:N-acetylneuraminic acid mutarotase
MAYDTESQVLVLFGGAVRVGSAFVNQPFGDTWAYDVAADSWTELAPAVSPPARAWHRMAYDPGSDRILLFGGGAPGGTDGLVWAYDANANTWEPFEATGPNPRWGGAVAFDEQSRKLIVVGGRGPVARSLGDAGTATEIVFLGDVWLFDPRADSWEGRDLLDDPAFWLSAAWDPATDRTVTFYGATFAYDVESDTWESQGPPDDLG